MAKKDEAVTEVKAADTNTNSEAYLRELVPVRIPKDSRNKGDVLVTVNGKKFQIQRGVEVKVPRYVAQVLDNKQRMEEVALDRMDELQKEYQDKEKAFG